MRSSTAAGQLHRQTASFLLRHHIENGLSVSLCFAAVVLGANAVAGLEAAVFVGSGAMCVSIVDQPGPLSKKAVNFAAALVSSSLVSLLAGLAVSRPEAMAVLVALTSLGFAFVSALGRSALVLGITAVLALVTGMAAPAQSAADAITHFALFFLGGATYALLASAAAWMLDDRNRRMFLNEALLALAEYLRARGDLYDRSVPGKRAVTEVIERHGALIERLQAARETIFVGTPTAARRRWIAAMVALLDLYEAVLATDADWEALRQVAEPEALHAISRLGRALADDIEAMAFVLSSGVGQRPACHHPDLIGALNEALARLTAAGHSDALAALQSTRNKLVQAVRRTRELAEAIAPVEDQRPSLPAIDLTQFLQPGASLRATFRAHRTLASPVTRYAIRLTLAMLAGYAATVAFPSYVHGGWILLTVALIMRANYAITLQRRNDRLLGTLVGCAFTAAVLPVLPTYGVVAIIIVSVGVAHAYAGVNYKITSFAASVMALLLLHFLEPQTFYVADRVADTLIGVAFSAIFARVLPSWEWNDVPRMVSELIAADGNFAAQALSMGPDEQAYRLARKQAIDKFTTLVLTTRRLSSEPHTNARQLISLNEMLAANYLFASDLASVQGILHRAAQLDAAAAATALDDARGRVMESLAQGGALPPPDSLRRRGWFEMSNAHPLGVLRRRLLHIEHSAQKLAARARSAAEGLPQRR